MFETNPNPSQNVLNIESGTPEAVAYRMMVKILGESESNSHKILRTYKDCLEAVKGGSPT